MEKIGIITFHKSVNYGSVLQAYALRATLEKLGYNAEVIDYQPDNYKYLYGLFRFPRNVRDIKFDIINFLHLSLLNKRKKQFADFRKKYLHLSKNKYQFGDDISSLNNIYSAIICGSDQIWNPKAKDSDVNFYLPIEHKAKKIAYAVSLNDGFANEYKDKAKYRMYIADFDSLSVREISAQSDLETFLGKNKRVQVVLDPTLLLQKQDFEVICAPRRIEGSYIFFYSVHHNPATVRAVQKLSERLSLPVYFLYTNVQSHKTTNNKQFMYPQNNISPEDFVSYIKNASFVVTDSFHGTAFSIIFEKKFFSIAKMDENGFKIRDERICGILELLGLSDRFVSEMEIENCSVKDQPDYVVVDEKRKKLIQKSIQFIKDAL